jgi:hypothetical protein
LRDGLIRLAESHTARPAHHAPRSRQLPARWQAVIAHRAVELRRARQVDRLIRPGIDGRRLLPTRYFVVSLLAILMRNGFSKSTLY